MREISFQGVRYVLVGSLKGGGPIAALDDYIHGRVSYAHLLADGRIMRFNKAIGARKDIKDFGWRRDPPIADDAWENLTTDAGGFSPSAQIQALCALASRRRTRSRWRMP